MDRIYVALKPPFNNDDSCCLYCGKCLESARIAANGYDDAKIVEISKNDEALSEDLP